jgi:hypothetical protein
MNEAHRPSATKTSLVASAMAAMLVLAGCGNGRWLFARVESATPRPADARLIEVEVDNLASGLPCKVVDRRNGDTQKVLWRAAHEQGFCLRKAEETRLVLQARGWSCRPQSADERLELARSSGAAPSRPPYLVAAWRCLQGLAPNEQVAALRPPIPTARPKEHASPAARWGNGALRAAVDKDLSTIGQDVLDEQTAVVAALGDLDADGVRDAIVVLTRDHDRGAPHRLLMAYLQHGGAYTLADVWILKAPDPQAGDELSLAIANGAIRLDYCCGETVEPSTVLVLDDRKLAYAKGS